MRRNHNIARVVAIDSGGKWEQMESSSKRATISEDKNEVIEIPARGHGRRVTRRSRTTPEDPRRSYSADEIKEKFIGTTKEIKEEKSDDGWLDTADVDLLLSEA